MSAALLVIGGTGRLGTAILEAAREDAAVTVAAVVARRARPSQGGGPAVLSDLDAALASVPDAVVIDAAPGDGAAERVAAVAGAGRPLVLAATGLDAAARGAVERAAERIAVVEAPNLSPGVALLARALRAVLEGVGPRWDVSILDRHHRHKRDAPSGTARMLSDLVQAARGEGGEPQVASFRQGDVVGEHTVVLSGPDEELILQHRAAGRRVFARGALLAAHFVATAPSGRYTMEDVLTGR